MKQLKILEELVPRKKRLELFIKIKSFWDKNIPKIPGATVTNKIKDHIKDGK